jgi:HAD superfamily hydrolase (TIGR01509 family)
MGSDRSIRGVLFDAGGVLIRPVGGRWNPRYDFEDVVLRHHPWIRAELFPQAFAAGQRALEASPVTLERALYHRAILQVLGVDGPSPALLHELEAPAAGAVIETFPDVRAVLDELRAGGIRMAVVSDTWAGLENLFRQIDIERYFEVFAISEVLGCRKPDPRMYRAGSDGLGLDPRECVFIDDDPALVAAANELGYHGVALVRDGLPPPGIRTMRSLVELPPFAGRALE